MNTEDFDHFNHPINALEVAKGFDVKWRDFGNDSSDSLLDLWQIVCRTFNKVYLYNHYKLDKNYLSLPAPTGSGKTQILKHYVSELVRQRNDIGVLIVTRYISDAEAVAKDINSCSNSLYAAEAYHSDSRISREELYKFNNIQVAVITHENYIKNHNTSSTNHNIYQQLMTFNNSEREVVIIDEEVNLINHIGVSKSSISTIESSLTALVSRTLDDTAKQELCLARYLHNNYDTLFYQKHQHKRLIGSKDSLLHRLSSELKATVDEVVELFELVYLKDNIRSGALKNINQQLNIRGVDTDAQNLKYLLDDNLYEYNNSHGYEYRTSTLEYPNKSIAILNATANLDSIGIPNLKTVKLPKVKTYEQVRLFKIKTNDRNLGKDAFNKLDASGGEEDVFNQMPETLCDFAEFDHDYEDGNNKELAFFTHKKVKEKLRVRTSKTNIDHFGNLLGVNKYKDCNNIIIYGIQIKPKYIYIDALMHSIGTDALLVENKDRLVDIEYADISADIVQAINRGRCRGIVNGKAPKMIVQLLMPNNKKLTNQLLTFITKSMPGIQVLDSPYTLDLTPQVKPVGDDVEFINAIDGYEGDIILKDIKDSLGISKKKWERMLKHLTKQEYNNSYLAVKVRMKGCKVTKKGKSYCLTKDR